MSDCILLLPTGPLFFITKVIFAEFVGQSGSPPSIPIDSNEIS